MSRTHGRSSKFAIALIALLALALVPAAASAKSASQHYLGIYKERGGTSDAGSTPQVYKGKDFILDDVPQVQWEEVSCGTGYPLDGMWRVDDVPYNPQVDEEGPYDEYNGVDVVASYSPDGHKWLFAFLNRSESEVQIKDSVICLPKSPVRADPTPVHEDVTNDATGHTHNWLLGSFASDVTGPASGGGQITGSTPACGSDEIAIAPGFMEVGSLNNTWMPGDDPDARFVALDGAAKVYKRLPQDSTVRSWDWGFWTNPASATDMDVSAWCLKTKSDAALDKQNHNHAHKLRFGITSLDWSEYYCNTHYEGTSGLANCPAANKKYQHVKGYSTATVPSTSGGPYPDSNGDELHRVSTPQLDCGQTEKAVMGGFDLTQPGTGATDTYTDSGKTWEWLGKSGYDPSGTSHHLHFLGMDPRPKSRNFRIDNVGTSDSQPLIESVCMFDRSGKRVAP